MKKILTIVIMTAIFAVQTLEVNAQSRREVRQEARSVQEEVERLTREGWRVMPGGLSMREQVVRSREMRREVDDRRLPKWVFGTASTPGQTFDVARFQAAELARIDLVGQFAATIRGAIETELGAEQLTETGMAQTVGVFTNEIAAALGRTVPVIELYREVPGQRGREVRLQIAYNELLIQERVRETVRRGMQERAGEIRERMVH